MPLDIHSTWVSVVTRCLKLANCIVFGLRRFPSLPRYPREALRLCLPSKCTIPVIVTKTLDRREGLNGSHGEVTRAWTAASLLETNSCTAPSGIGFAACPPLETPSSGFSCLTWPPWDDPDAEASKVVSSRHAEVAAALRFSAPAFMSSTLQCGVRGYGCGHYTGGSVRVCAG